MRVLVAKRHSLLPEHNWQSERRGSEAATFSLLGHHH